MCRQRLLLHRVVGQWRMLCGTRGAVPQKYGAPHEDPVPARRGCSDAGRAVMPRDGSVERIQPERGSVGFATDQAWPKAADTDRNARERIAAGRLAARAPGG